MKREKTFRFVTILGLLRVLLIPVLSEGFDDKAHIDLSRRATELSTLDSFLTTILGFEFPKGRNETVVNGKTVTELVGDGAFDEDRPILGEELVSGFGYLLNMKGASSNRRTYRLNHPGGIFSMSLPLT